MESNVENSDDLQSRIVDLYEEAQLDGRLPEATVLQTLAGAISGADVEQLALLCKNFSHQKLAEIDAKRNDRLQ